MALSFVVSFRGGLGIGGGGVPTLLWYLPVASHTYLAAPLDAELYRKIPSGFGDQSVGFIPRESLTVDREPTEFKNPADSHSKIGMARAIRICEPRETVDHPALSFPQQT